LPAEWVTVLGVGLLGGYTTFSAASLETAELLGRRRFFLAAASGLGVCAICLAAAAAALALAGP
jgi:CrcB protein